MTDETGNRDAVGEQISNSFNRNELDATKSWGKVALNAIAGASMFFSTLLGGMIAENEIDLLANGLSTAPVHETFTGGEGRDISVRNVTLAEGASFTIESEDEEEKSCRARIGERYSYNPTSEVKFVQEYKSEDGLTYVKVYEPRAREQGAVSGSAFQFLCVISLVHGGINVFLK